MDPKQPSSNVNKPTGLPRPTRLPVSTPTSSRLPLPKQQGHQDLAKASPESARLQKRPSIPTFTQSKPPARQPLSSRTNGLVHVPKSSTSTASARPSVARPSSRTSQRSLAAASTQSLVTPDDEETHDQLSSLESFRSASRQSSYDQSAPSIPILPAVSGNVEPVEPSEPPKERDSSRPSLCDRTIESIQNIPSTPKDRRRSSFFSPIESPMGPPPRPNSSLSRNGSNGGSRPGTSDGTFAKPSTRLPSAAKKAPSSAKPTSRSSTGGLGIAAGNSTRRSLSSTFRTEAPSGVSTIPSTLRSSSSAKKPADSTKSSGVANSRVVSASKTVAARPAKVRPSLSDAFKPAVPGETIKRGSAKNNKVEATSLAGETTPPDSTPPKSSAALRQQIAAARAAARKDKNKHDSPQSASTSNDNAFEAHVDPFNQAPRDEKHILRNRINVARTDGRLNIAAMNIKQIPDEVLHMYDPAAMEESRVSWAEVVDLTRFIAADNELEELPDSIFPDRSVEDYDLDDDAEGNQFAGLEMLDLHANSIPSLPIGLRRLQRLTSLNLSHNKLENPALDVIAQIPTLRDLKLGFNSISGSLPSSICQLPHLESLDIRSNRLLSLPDALRELVSLRVLNVSGNQLTALPIEALQDIRLSELDASNNGLIASLFPVGGPSAHPTLQVIHVANNSLAAVTFDARLDLPQLHTLDVTCNNITSLPSVSAWPELVTLLAGENKISELPDGFTTLPKIRNVNLTSNEIRALDPQIGLMDSLESLILASNPLRERKFLTMSASDIKRNLKARLEPNEADGLASANQATEDRVQGEQPATAPRWVLKAQDTLDLSRGTHRDDVNNELGEFLANNTVRGLYLQSNVLTAIPPAIAIGQSLKTLDLSGNAFRTDFLSAELRLPFLEDLNMSRCNMTTLEPLITYLQAPRLQTINVAANRLSGLLPTLRSSFPALTTLMISENRIKSITADALRGLRVVNLADNDVEQLPAEIGLLWDEGLHTFEIGRNAFRVPSYRVLEKGTEATLRWLRDKLPSTDDGVS